jgi:hypothetical protein
MVESSPAAISLHLWRVLLRLLHTYAYLGEDRTPVMEWLAACLWYSLTYNPIFIDSDYKIALGRAHKGIVDRAESLGVSVREWMDSELGKRPEYR